MNLTRTCFSAFLGAGSGCTPKINHIAYGSMGNKPTRSKSKRKIDVELTALPSLPMEMWEIILSYCTPMMLLYDVPLVSKICKSIMNNLWKIKMSRDYPELKEDPFDNDCWKDLYLGPHRLFPLMGFTITKTTFKELTKIKGVIAAVSDYATSSVARCTIDDYVFYCTDQIFTKIELIYGLDNAIPEDWQRQGINWMKSVNEYVELFDRSTGNYYVEDPLPGAKGKCRVRSVVKQRIRAEVIYYEIVLVFDKARSEAGPDFFREAPFTLESILVRSYLPGSDYDALATRFKNALAPDDIRHID